MEIETKLDEIGTAFEEFKKVNDARIKAIEEKGYAPAELEAKTDNISEAMSKLQDEIKGLQTAANRKGVDGGGDPDNKGSEFSQKYNTALLSYLRDGDNAAELKAMRRTPEYKDMSVDSDPNGGFLVSPQTSAEVVKKVFESSPIRQLASVQSISTDSLEILEDLDEVGSGWVSEQAARPKTASPTLKQIVIFAHEIYAQPQATQKLLDDASFNVEAWLGGKAGEKFARDEATAFVGGNGVGKPKGFLSHVAGTGFNQIEQIVSGSAGAVAADGLISLFYSLKGPYLANANWLLERLTVAAVRKLKGSDNNYLWQPGLAAGQPDLILGKPMMQADDMPSIAADSLSIAFGDFRAGYQIVDRVGIRTLRDPFTAKPHILFYTTKRVGGAVKNFEAIKLQKLSA